MKKYLAIVGLCATLAAGGAFAQRSATFTGAGTISCGEFIKNKDSLGAEGIFVQWATGYISAYNFYSTSAQVRTPESSTVLLYAEKHCRSKPLDSYAQAVAALIDELGGYSNLGERKSKKQ